MWEFTWWSWQCRHWQMWPLCTGSQICPWCLRDPVWCWQNPERREDELSKCAEFQTWCKYTAANERWAKVVHWDGESLPRTFYLDLKCSLEAAGKEATEGPHNGGEGGESDAVDLERIQTHGGLWTQEDRVGGKPPQFTEPNIYLTWRVKGCPPFCRIYGTMCRVISVGWCGKVLTVIQIWNALWAWNGPMSLRGEDALNLTAVAFPQKTTPLKLTVSKHRATRKIDFCHFNTDKNGNS